MQIRIEPKSNNTAQYESRLAEMENSLAALKENFENKLLAVNKEPDIYIINEESYARERQEILHQYFSKLMEAKASLGPCQIFIEKYRLDVNLQDSKGFCLLHRASNPELVSLLLEKGANTELTLNYKEKYDYRGFTPLHWHVVKANVGIVELLLKARACVNACTEMEATPLLLAAKILPGILDNRRVPTDEARKIIEDLIELLMSYGGNIRARNISTRDGERHFAMGSPEGHTRDRFAAASRFAEEQLGKQLGKSAQAWNLTTAQKPRVAQLKEKQDHLNNAVCSLATDTKELTNQVDQLMALLNLELPTNTSPMALPFTQKSTAKKKDNQGIAIGQSATLGFFPAVEMKKTVYLCEEEQQVCRSVFAGEMNKVVHRDSADNKKQFIF